MRGKEGAVAFGGCAVILGAQDEPFGERAGERVADSARQLGGLSGRA